MNVLFIGYWGANEGLSQATINPHLELLLGNSVTSKVVYVSIERKRESVYRLPESKKLLHIPLKADRTRFRLLNKVIEVILFGNKLVSIARGFQIDLVICRSSLAGNFGLRVKKSLKIPFVVESFEPHAEYMRELGVWRYYGLSYQYQKWKEKRQLKHAILICPVSHNYTNYLVQEGISKEKVATLPCAVNIEKFRFSEEKRKQKRTQLAIQPGALVSIYVGKFEGIYFSLEDSLALFKKCKEHFANFFLILLCPDSEEVNKRLANEVDIHSWITVLTVPHDDVGDYLSASDCAFSLHRPIESMRYVSPIKNGEYWANGLPIIISDGIGDDSLLLKESSFGVVMRNSVPIDQSLNQLYSLIQKEGHRQEIVTLARKYRSFDTVELIYNKLLTSK